MSSEPQLPTMLEMSDFDFSDLVEIKNKDLGRAIAQGAALGYFCIAVIVRPDGYKLRFVKGVRQLPLEGLDIQMYKAKVLP